MKFKIYKYRKITSTNDKAINFIKKNLNECGYIDADMQTKGRGTRGRKWISQKGNLFGSIFFPLKKTYPSFHEFLFINPIIIYTLLKKQFPNLNLNLKWPNDILINKKKFCGILQEVIQKDKLNYLIIGIGINLLNDPKFKFVKTGNIYKETNIKVKKELMIKNIIKSYENFFLRIKKYDFLYYKKKAESLAIKL